MPDMKENNMCPELIEKIKNGKININFINDFNIINPHGIDVFKNAYENKDNENV